MGAIAKAQRVLSRRSSSVRSVIMSPRSSCDGARETVPGPPARRKRRNRTAVPPGLGLQPRESYRPHRVCVAHAPIPATRRRRSPARADSRSDHLSRPARSPPIPWVGPQPDAGAQSATDVDKLTRTAAPAQRLRPASLRQLARRAGRRLTRCVLRRRDDGQAADLARRVRDRVALPGLARGVARHPAREWVRLPKLGIDPA